MICKKKKKRKHVKAFLFPDKLFTREMVIKKSSPYYWPVFSYVLQTFKLLGIMPVTIFRVRDKDGEKMKIQFSRGGFVIAVIFLILTSVHTIWAPTMLINLEKAIVASYSNSSNKTITDGIERRTFNTKLAAIVKILHPLLVSVTTLTARILSVSILAKATPVLFKAIARVDGLLCLPPEFYTNNFGVLTCLTVFTVVLHVPIVTVHLWQVSSYRDLWGNAWEVFTMINVFTAFSLELEFVLFCESIRSRFKFINDTLTSFVSEDFLYDMKSKSKLKKIFSKWKKYVGPRNRKIFSSTTTQTKGQLFKLFSKMDAINGGRHYREPENVTVSLIQVGSTRKKPEPETWNQLKSLRCGHVLLFDVMQLVNDIYQVHLFVSIFSSVTKILFNFYFTIFGFVTATRVVPANVQNGELYLINLWSVYYCLRFMLIVNFAHFAASESKEARKIVSKIDPRDFEFPSKKEVKMLSDHLSKRDFEFSACGFFNLNTSLISTSFSTGITYLVIMAQFH